MGNSFEEVTLSVCKVVHRVGFPSGSGTVVRMFHHTIDNRVAEVHIRVCHVDFGTEHHSTFFDLATVHLAEQGKALFDRTVAVRAFGSRLGGSSFLCGDLFGSLLVDVGFSFLDQPYGKVPELLEIIGCIIHISPLETQPFDIFFDGFYILYVLFGRVCIVETKVAHATVTGCQTEIKANSLGMADMKVAVRFRRETCLHLSSVFTFF